MHFEKWQALGNDYLILEAEALPWELTPGRIRALCAPHTGVFGDGVLLLSALPHRLGPPAEPVAQLRIFNPDGSESGLSGNGAREAILYLRHRGWTDRDEFSILTPAGEIHARITDARTCSIDIGRVRLSSEDFPSGGADGRGELTAAGRAWRFQHVQVGNPQCAIAVPDATELHALALSELGPVIEHHQLFPQRTNVSWFTELGPGRIQARIFERGVGETTASGTGATGAAVAYVLHGGSSPVTVQLDGGHLTVAVSDDLHVNLTGWAVPVFTGELAGDFLEALHATE